MINFPSHIEYLQIKFHKTKEKQYTHSDQHFQINVDSGKKTLCTMGSSNFTISY